MSLIVKRCYNIHSQNESLPELLQTVSPWPLPSDHAHCPGWNSVAALCARQWVRFGSWEAPSRGRGRWGRSAHSALCPRTGRTQSKAALASLSLWRSLPGCGKCPFLCPFRKSGRRISTAAAFRGLHTISSNFLHPAHTITIASLLNLP